jgi:thymidylate kinase
MLRCSGRRWWPEWLTARKETRVRFITCLFNDVVTLRTKDGSKLRIVILGPDGSGKSSVIDGLKIEFAHRGLKLYVRHLKPRIVATRRGQPETVVANPHGKPARTALFSVAKIAVWLMEEWYARFFQEKEETLLLCDRYYHDLLIDPKRYRYGGPLWAAKMAGRLMPQPNLWILLDAPAELLQNRKQEVPVQETLRQLQAYRAFVLEQRWHAIIDAAQSLDRVIADVERAIGSAGMQNGASHGSD